MDIENLSKYYEDFLSFEPNKAPNKKKTMQRIIDECDQLNEEFCQAYPKKKLKELTLEEYALGSQNSYIAQNSFCYWLEFRTKIIGSISGGYSSKYGVYHYNAEKMKATGKEYWTKKIYSDENDAIIKIRSDLAKIVEYAEEQNFQAIEEMSLPSPTIKYKTLYMYYPEERLPIFAPYIYNHFINQLGYSTANYTTMLEKEACLLEFKKNDPLFNNISNLAYTKFLYYLFGYIKKIDENGTFEIKDGFLFRNDSERSKFTILKEKAPTVKGRKKQKQKSIVENFDYSKKSIQFAPLPVQQNDRDKDDETEENMNVTNKPDFEAIQERRTLRGRRGEEIALKYEEDRLKAYGDYSEKIIHVSKKNDSKGYDILSVEADGQTPRYIEVKATTKKLNDVASFYLSRNEMRKSLKFPDNYWIYYVTEVDQWQPSVTEMQICFDEANSSVQMIPTNYLINVGVKPIIDPSR